MTKLRLSLPLVAAASLAGCGGYEPVTPSPGQVVGPPVAAAPAPPPAVVYPPGTVVQQGAPVAVQPGYVRPGWGRVESSTRLSQASGLDRPVRRIGVRMDDGTTQFVDTQAQEIMVGERVELTRDNHIRYGPMPPG